MYLPTGSPPASSSTGEASYGDRSTQMLPVIRSEKLPDCRFSFPANESDPVAPASLPVAPVTGPEAAKSPVVKLNDAVTPTVSGPGAS